ncbi:hypothetical protein HG530_004786 [Fusarium avenaceum]|nr:hypothetical protein HG530_004786 [Fusarium avenaceum]
MQWISHFHLVDWSLQVHAPFVIVCSQISHTFLQSSSKLFVIQATAFRPASLTIYLHLAVSNRSDLESPITPGIVPTLGTRCCGTRLGVPVDSSSSILIIFTRSLIAVLEFCPAETTLFHLCADDGDALGHTVDNTLVLANGVDAVLVRF